MKSPHPSKSEFFQIGSPQEKSLARIVKSFTTYSHHKSSQNNYLKIWMDVAKELKRWWTLPTDDQSGD